MTTVSRNAPCPCGSGLKYKKCHGAGPVQRQPVDLRPEKHADADDQILVCDSYWVDAYQGGPVHLVIGEHDDALEVLQMSADEADVLADRLRQAATEARREENSDLESVTLAHEHGLGLGLAPEGFLDVHSEELDVALELMTGVVQLPLEWPELRVPLPEDDARVQELRATMPPDLDVYGLLVGEGPEDFHALVDELDTDEQRQALITTVRHLAESGSIRQQLVDYVELNHARSDQPFDLLTASVAASLSA